MRSGIVLAIIVIGTLVNRPAFAAKPQALEKQAKKACLSGDYAKGVSILADLFVDTNDPNYLYNQGRCYEQNLHYAEAAERFKEFLRKAGNLSDGLKSDVDKHIADCEAAIAKTQPARQPEDAIAKTQPVRQPEAAPPAAPTGNPGPIPSAASAPETAAPPLSAPATQVGEVHPWQHTAKWIATGAAVAFLGFGAVEHVRYYGKNDDFNNDPTCPSNPTSASCKSLADAADSAQTMAIIGYSAAAVATGAAVLFWLTDSPRPASSSQARLRFMCAPALAGIGCVGSF